jgi:hypothetical protein
MQQAVTGPLWMDGSDHGIFTERLLRFMDSDDSIDEVFGNLQKTFGTSLKANRFLFELLAHILWNGALC